MNEDLYNIINTNLVLCKMSGGGTRAHYIRSDSNDTNYDTSSVQLLLDTETQKNRKRRKVLIMLEVAIGVAVTCLVLLLCVILLSSKSDGNVNLVKRNNTLDRSNLSSNQKAYNNETTRTTRTTTTAAAMKTTTAIINFGNAYLLNNR